MPRVVIENQWSDSWPDFEDDGRRVTLLMRDGREIDGSLEVFGAAGPDDDVPLLRVRLDNGDEHSFAAAERWRFTNSRADD